MPQDAFHIALEHHRAGRLSQARAGYAAVLEIDPAHADALHWLGVLHLQAGRADDAVDLLQQSVALRPDDAAYLFNFAEASRRVGRLDDAIATLERARRAAPEAWNVALALASARLGRAAEGDAAAAGELLRAAIGALPPNADAHRLLGIALLACNEAALAIASLNEGVKLRPDDAQALYFLGLAHRANAQLKECRRSLIKALEIDPGMSRGWLALGMLDIEAGRYDTAAGLLRRAIATDPADLRAHRELITALLAAGRYEAARLARLQADAAMKASVAARDGEARSTAGTSAQTAVDALQARLTPTADQAQAHFALAALHGVFPPAQIPAHSVSKLFDGYATNFDAHLQDTLHYRVPEMLAEAIRPLWSGRPMDVLDLGCGTGLCGPLLRPMARSLAGADLSNSMLEQARQRGVYDRLDQCDLVAAIRQATQGVDLLVAADVLIYVGDLSSAFEAAAGALRTGGMFVFSVEAGKGNRFELSLKNRRYRHSAAYLRHLASIYGFATPHWSEIVIRHESDQPVRGFLVVLRRDAN